MRRVSAVGLRIPVVGTLTRWLAHQIFSKGQRVWIQIPSGPANGLWLKADPYYEQRYFSGNPEPGVQQAIAQHLKPGDCFYDVGAHIGFYTLLAARLVGETGQVFAFEPDPANVEILRENLARNVIPNARVIPSAVWSSAGRVRFERKGIASGTESSRRGSIVTDANARLDSPIIEVESISLDASVGPRPAMIKVDVEGAEAEVLKGAERLLTSAKPIWLIEVHHTQAKASCEAALANHRYRIDWLRGHPGYEFPRHMLAIPAS